MISDGKKGKDGTQTEWSNKGLILYKHSYSNNILRRVFRVFQRRTRIYSGEL